MVEANAMSALGMRGWKVSTTLRAAVVFCQRPGKIFLLQSDGKRLDPDFKNCHGNHHGSIVEVVVHINPLSGPTERNEVKGSGETSEAFSEIGQRLG